MWDKHGPAQKILGVLLLYNDAQVFLLLYKRNAVCFAVLQRFQFSQCFRAGVGMQDDGGEQQTAFLSKLATEQAKMGNLQGQSFTMLGASVKKAEFATAGTHPWSWGCAWIPCLQGMQGLVVCMLHLSCTKQCWIFLHV